MGGMLPHGSRATTFTVLHGSLKVLSHGLVFTGVLYGCLGGGVKIVVIREFVCDVTREFCNPVRVFVKLPLETPVRNSR